MDALETDGATTPVPTEPGAPQAFAGLLELARRTSEGVALAFEALTRSLAPARKLFEEVGEMLRADAILMGVFPPEPVYPCRCVCLMHRPGVCAGETDLMTGHVQGGPGVLGLVCGPCAADLCGRLVTVIEVPHVPSPVLLGRVC